MLFRSYPKLGQMSYELERLGGWYNAYTDTTDITYFLVGSIVDYRKITELGLEQYTSPLFRPKNITEQKKVVEREFKRSIDNDDDRIRNLNMSRLFPDRPVFAQERIDTLKSISKNDIERYYKSTHTQANTVFVISGDLNSSKQKVITEIISKSLDALPVGKRLLNVPKPELKNLKSIQSLPSKLKGQLHFSVTFVRADYDPSIQFRAACYVASSIYNRGDSSRLFRKARNAGLA